MCHCHTSTVPRMWSGLKELRSGQVRSGILLGQNLGLAMRVTRQLMLPPSAVT
jgi:hypothetical protein